MSAPASPRRRSRFTKARAEARAIYGESGEEELERLDEEGVAYHRIPWVPKDDA